MSKYLFVHFIGEGPDGEQIYFSVSKDGLHWQDLNDGKPVLKSSLGEEGVRDPFIVQDPNSKDYFLIATDLRIGAYHDWNRAEYCGSKDIIVWQSKNLIDWSDEWSVKVGIDLAGCVWAPEAIFDQEKQSFLVFFASMVKEGNEKAKQRIYASYTTNFRDFTPTEKYIERKNHIIDTNIIQNDGIYYRFSKDETTKTIDMERGTSLAKDAFVKVETPLLDSLYALEGPECYQLPDGTWCLIADQFGAGLGYLPILIPDLENPEMTIMDKADYNLGQTKKRHGGVIKITDEEYESLMASYTH